MSTMPDDLARQVLEVVPQVMRAIRDEMRRHRDADLSVPEFRTLAFLNRRAGASLTDVADHIGLTLSSMSKLIEGLVERKLVTREFALADRRRVTLALTAQGGAIWQAAHAPTQAYLEEILATLAPAERENVAQALRVLRPLFISAREKQTLVTRPPNGNS